VSWVEEDRRALVVHRRLTEAAQEWVTLEREPGALYRGARLLSATDWAKEHDSELNPLEREFLVASRAAESSELEESKRRSRRLRALAIGLAVLLVLAAVSALLAVAAARRAQRQQDIALSRALAT